MSNVLCSGVTKNQELMTNMITRTLAALCGFLDTSYCVYGVFLRFFRIRRHVHNIGSKELMDAWNDKGKRLLD